MGWLFHQCKIQLIVLQYPCFKEEPLYSVYICVVFTILNTIMGYAARLCYDVQRRKVDHQGGGQVNSKQSIF